MKNIAITAFLALLTAFALVPTLGTVRAQLIDNNTTVTNGTISDNGTGTVPITPVPTPTPVPPTCTPNEVLVNNTCVPNLPPQPPVVTPPPGPTPCTCNQTNTTTTGNGTGTGTGPVNPPPPVPPVNNTGGNNTNTQDKVLVATMTVSKEIVQRGQTETIFVRASDNATGQPVVNADVQLVVVTFASGHQKTIVGGTTNDQGLATINVKIAPHSTPGQFKVTAQVSANGYKDNVTVGSGFVVIPKLVPIVQPPVVINATRHR